MTESLFREDWERILLALSHFRHNRKINETYEKVQAILNTAGDD